MTEERYKLAIGRIQEIGAEQTVDVKFRDYFCKMADFVIMIDELKSVLSEGARSEEHTSELQSQR